MTPKRTPILGIGCLLNGLNDIVIIVDIWANAIRPEGAQDNIVHTVNIVVGIKEIVLSPGILGNCRQVGSSPVRETPVGGHEACIRGTQIPNFVVIRRVDPADLLMPWPFVGIGLQEDEGLQIISISAVALITPWLV